MIEVLLWALFGSMIAYALVWYIYYTWNTNKIIEKLNAYEEKAKQPKSKQEEAYENYIEQKHKLKDLYLLSNVIRTLIKDQEDKEKEAWLEFQDTCPSQDLLPREEKENDK